MKDWYSIKECFREYKEAHNLSLAWLIKAWELKDEDHDIAMSYFKKAKKQRQILAKRLEELCHD